MTNKPVGQKTKQTATNLDKDLQDPHSKALLDVFDFDNPVLAPIIDDNALSSAHHPYDKKMKRNNYEKQLLKLQIELVKLQLYIQAQDQRILLIFEGRDTAGKGGTVKRFMEHMNPRNAKVVALAKPTEAEQGQWYFQRYIKHLPEKGDMALFDRSWYNRAGVEPVMGFCSLEQNNHFLQEVPKFEAMLVNDGIHLFKFFLTIGQEMQLKRLHARRHDPLKHWKLSPIDLKAITKWTAYSAAHKKMFEATHTDHAPWTVLRANDKRRARLGAIRHVLQKFDYPDKDSSVVNDIDKTIVGSGKAFFKGA